MGKPERATSGLPDTDRGQEVIPMRITFLLKTVVTFVATVAAKLRIRKGR